MTSKNENIQAFNIKDCAVMNIATGVRAQNLKELRNQLLTIHPESILHHFWAKKLRPSFEEPEYNNDFASWAYTNLQDIKLAERMSLINPKFFSDTEDLRRKLIEVVELSLEENKSTLNTKDNEQFHFIRSEIVVFDTKHIICKPEELTELLPNLSLGSIYFHFIDSKRRSDDTTDDISSWLSVFGDEYKGLIDPISKLDPYFFTLPRLRIKVSNIFKGFFKGAKI